MREPTAFRTPHQRKTKPIPAVTRVARTPTTVLTLICEVIAEMTEAQSEAVTTLEGGSDRGISSNKAETVKTSNADTKNTSLNQLYINRTAKAVMNNIIFVPRKNLINGICLIKNISGDFFHIRDPAATLPSIPGHLLGTMQIVVVVVGTVKLASPVLDA
jgi:hypothetical protein